METGSGKLSARRIPFRVVVLCERVGELEPESGASRARTIRSIGDVLISPATISHARDVTISLVIPAKLERRFFDALISYNQ